MDEVFGDATQSSVVDQERLLTIHKRIGLDAYLRGIAHGDDLKHSTEKVEIVHNA